MPPQQQDMPTLLGRSHVTAQTLPARRLASEGDETAPVLRRRPRARIATTRGIASENFFASSRSMLDVPLQNILRPSRVILTTAAGMHSMCLPHDCEARRSFVLAGLPAGPVLPQCENCAICLEAFQSGERVQLMAKCRHAFHSACVEGFLRSQMEKCLAGEASVACPLCRGPLMAEAIHQVPCRERPLATIVDASWFQCVSPNTTIGREQVTPRVSVSVKPCDEKVAHRQESTVLGNSTIPQGDEVSGVCGKKSAAEGSLSQPRKAALRRAGTAPLQVLDHKRPVLGARSSTAPLEALCESLEKDVNEIDA